MLYPIRIGMLVGLIAIGFTPARASTPGSVLAAKTGMPELTQNGTPPPTPLVSPTATKSPTAPPKNLVIKYPTTTSKTGSNGAFGVAGNMASLSPSELNQSLDEIKSLGVGWVRYDIEWSNVEQSPGQYNWAPYDREVQAVEAHGLQSLVIIDYTPSWARRNDCSSSKMCAPADPNNYASFAATVANRYTPYGVKYWEIWNEPNNCNFYLPAANPGEYTAMLKLTYARIKQVNASATVLTGGTAPADTSNGNVSPIDFINGIYATGGRGSFDAIAVHPYTWPYSPAWTNPNGAWGQMTTIRNIMVNNGDGNKKVWITEYGAPTGGPGGIATSGFSTAEGHADHVTEALQARIVSDSIGIESKLSWIGPYFWYAYKDAGTTNDSVENFFGLLRADGTQKTAYAVFKQMVATH